MADVSPSQVARALVEGAREELELSPKPGLVDRIDNGSHPDLSFDAMRRSIGLLPQYFEELLAIGPDDLPACVDAGKRAEQRMLEAIGTNAHRGYIFLAGLVVLAAIPQLPPPQRLRRRIAWLATQLLAGREVDEPSHGAAVRRTRNVTGIVGEALAGLPSVFEHGLPRYRASLSGLELQLDHAEAVRTARHYLMAVLMQKVEDTTTVYRCGPAGLQRLKDDGARLQRLVENLDDHVPFLVELNRQYRAQHLTMGGVADCMALTLGLVKVIG